MIIYPSRRVMAGARRTKMKGKMPTMKVMRKEMLSAARAESRPFSSETPTDSSMKRALTRRAYPMFLLMTFQFISCRGS